MAVCLVRGMKEDEAERWRRRDAPSRGAESEACRADRAEGKFAPSQDVLLSPSSITERSIQAHSGGAAGDLFEVIGDQSALAPTTLPPSLSLLALPPELLTLVAVVRVRVRVSSPWSPSNSMPQPEPEPEPAPEPAPQPQPQPQPQPPPQPEPS